MNTILSINCLSVCLSVCLLYFYSGPLSSPSESFDFSALEEDAINRTKAAKLLAPIDSTPSITVHSTKGSTASSANSVKYSNVKGIASLRASYDTKPSVGAAAAAGTLSHRSVSMSDAPVATQGSVAARSIAYGSVKGKQQLQVRHSDIYIYVYTYACYILYAHY